MRLAKWKKAFSIVLAIWLALLIWLLAIYIIDYMYPFSRNVKWIENSSKAYYLANSWIEEMVYFINKNNIWTESWQTMVTTSTWYSFELVANWRLLPPLGEGNSEFDDDWNTIKQWEPIQFNLSWKPESFNGARFVFRVPNLWWWIPTKIKDITDMPIIVWQLSWSWQTLNAYSWSYIFADDIGDYEEFDTITDWDIQNWSSYSTLKTIDLNNKEWKTLSWSLENFSTFYDNNCRLITNKCTLNLFVANKLILNNLEETPIPYLEWKFALDSTNTDLIPLRFARIDSSGKSYWFKKDLDAKIPQSTIIEAFTITVFQ